MEELSTLIHSIVGLGLGSIIGGNIAEKYSFDSMFIGASIGAGIVLVIFVIIYEFVLRFACHFHKGGYKIHEASLRWSPNGSQQIFK